MRNFYLGFHLILKECRKLLSRISEGIKPKRLAFTTSLELQKPFVANMKFASIWLWPLILGPTLCLAEFTNFDKIPDQSLKQLVEEAIAKSNLQLQLDDLKVKYIDLENELSDLKLKYFDLESTINSKVHKVIKLFQITLVP